jgi:hypothetical protein
MDKRMGRKLGRVKERNVKGVIIGLPQNHVAVLEDFFLLANNFIVSLATTCHVSTEQDPCY